MISLLIIKTGASAPHIVDRMPGKKRKERTVDGEENEGKTVKGRAKYLIASSLSDNN